MHDTNEGNTPRLRVVEVVSSTQQQKSIQTQSHARNKRNKHRSHNTEIDRDQKDIVKYAMEMKPVLEAVLAYGRKTHGLGTLKGSQALVALINKIQVLAKQDFPIAPSSLDKIIEEAEEASINLKTTFVQAYEEG